MRKLGSPLSGLGVLGLLATCLSSWLPHLPTPRQLCLHLPTLFPSPICEPSLSSPDSQTCHVCPDYSIWITRGIGHKLFTPVASSPSACRSSLTEGAHGPSCRMGHSVGVLKPLRTALEQRPRGAPVANTSPFKWNDSEAHSTTFQRRDRRHSQRQRACPCPLWWPPSLPTSSRP